MCVRFPPRMCARPPVDLRAPAARLNAPPCASNLKAAAKSAACEKNKGISCLPYPNLPLRFDVGLSLVPTAVLRLNLGSSLSLNGTSRMAALKFKIVL